MIPFNGLPQHYGPASGQARRSRLVDLEQVERTAAVSA
jgi:hypothetical protein